MIAGDWSWRVTGPGRLIIAPTLLGSRRRMTSLGRCDIKSGLGVFAAT
ncbi:MAG: hypothetical protein ACYC0V_05700 [Armatimonadota bacterium]